jgi:hypothetical protein
MNCLALESKTSSTNILTKKFATQIQSENRKQEAVPIGKGEILKVGRFSFCCSWLMAINEFELQMMPGCCRIGIQDSKPFIFCLESESKVCCHANSNSTMFEVALEKLMGEKVWLRFGKQYLNFARRGAIQRGYGNNLLAQVQPVVEWYIECKDKMDHLVQVAQLGKVSSLFFSLWLEFKAMWIDGSKGKQAIILEYVISGDVGLENCLGGNVNHGNLYGVWRSLR